MNKYNDYIQEDKAFIDSNDDSIISIRTQEYKYLKRMHDTPVYVCDDLFHNKLSCGMSTTEMDRYTNKVLRKYITIPSISISKYWKLEGFLDSVLLHEFGHCKLNHGLRRTTKKIFREIEAECFADNLGSSFCGFLFEERLIIDMINHFNMYYSGYVSVSMIPIIVCYIHLKETDSYIPEGIKIAMDVIHKEIASYRQDP